LFYQGFIYPADSRRREIKPRQIAAQSMAESQPLRQAREAYFTMAARAFGWQLEKADWQRRK
jgi:hypothetical protein